MLREQYIEAVTEAALRWDLDKGAEADLLAALAIYRKREFVAIDERETGRAVILFYNAGVEQIWAENVETPLAQKMVFQLNERLKGGWDGTSAEAVGEVVVAP